MRFTVTFSEPVTGFDVSDVQLSGSADDWNADVTGSGVDYDLRVPVTSNGDVNVSVPAGVAQDAVGNLSAASDGSIVVDQPTLTTDASDYSPGSVVTMTGANWAPGATVTITLVRVPPFAVETSWTVTADENGNFTDSSYNTTFEDSGASFVAARSATMDNGASVVFTDAPSDCFKSVANGNWNVAADVAERRPRLRVPRTSPRPPDRRRPPRPSRSLPAPPSRSPPRQRLAW